jgi:hypothetical protein
MIDKSLGERKSGPPGHIQRRCKKVKGRRGKREREGNEKSISVLPFLPFLHVYYLDWLGRWKERLRLRP